MNYHMNKKTSTFFRNIAAVAMMLLGCATLQAQDVTVTNVEVSEGDLTARTRPVEDASGNICGVVKVSIPGHKGITFQPQVKTVDAGTGEYSVFLSPDTPELNILENGAPFCTVNFADYGVKIEPKMAYIVSLKIPQMGRQDFTVEPETASLTIDGASVTVEQGFASFEGVVGKTYSYTVSMPGYNEKSGTFTITDATKNLNKSILLSQKEGTIQLTTNLNKESILYVDNEELTNFRGQVEVTLPVGTHDLAVETKGYSTETRTIYIPEEQAEADAQPMPVNFYINSKVSNKLRTRSDLYVIANMLFDANSFKHLDDITSKKYTNMSFGLGYDAEFYLVRSFISLRWEAIEATAYIKSPFKKRVPLAFTTAPLINFGTAIDRLNTCFFTFGFGPVGGITTYLNTETDSDEAFDGSNSEWMFGGRAEARFTFNKVLFGARMEYMHYTKDILSKKGFAASIILGYRF